MAIYIGDWNMVESIFGGKATYPSGCYERNFFQTSLVEGRLSLHSTHLKTISETGDDSASLDGASNEPKFQNVVNGGQSSFRRPRTKSLPAIYRDGSYLRIKPSTIAAVSCQKRRYSEPAVFAAEQIIHRLARRSSNNSSFSDESESGSCKRSSAQSVDCGCTTRRESTRKDLSTPRRHSDPLCYVTEHTTKSGLPMARREKSRNKVLPEEAMKSHTASQLQANDAGNGVRFARRRKSSLVPVPFNSPVNSTRKPRDSKTFPRPESFPPSKRESKRHYSLPSLNLKHASTFLKSERDNTWEIGSDWSNNLQIDEQQTCESEEENKDLEDKYAGNEDILVQWMKFFG